MRTAIRMCVCINESSNCKPQSLGKWLDCETTAAGVGTTTVGGVCKTGSRGCLTKPKSKASGLWDKGSGAWVRGVCSG